MDEQQEPSAAEQRAGAERRRRGDRRRAIDLNRQGAERRFVPGLERRSEDRRGDGETDAEPDPAETPPASE